jgi:hypothetical protein
MELWITAAAAAAAAVHLGVSILQCCLGLYKKKITVSPSIKANKDSLVSVAMG